jgi:hypothetical protein
VIVGCGMRLLKARPNGVWSPEADRKQVRRKCSSEAGPAIAIANARFTLMAGDGARARRISGLIIELERPSVRPALMNGYHLISHKFRRCHIRVPYENDLISVGDGIRRVSSEGRLYVVGNRDSSVLLHFSAQNTGFIVIEFLPHGTLSHDYRPQKNPG